eukprot:15362793-Ditylum_brightwellii.AAC.2
MGGGSRLTRTNYRKHDKNGPATMQGKHNSKAVNGIWWMPGVRIQKGGYLPFHKRIKSNHHLLWIKLSLIYTFGSKEAAIKNVPSRLLYLQDKQGQHHYKKIVGDFIKRHRVQERMEKLLRTAKFPLSVDEMRELKVLGQLRTKAQTHGERGCRKVYVRGIESHPEVKKARMGLRLVDSLIGCKEGTKKTK